MTSGNFEILSVLSKHFNKDSSSENTFSYLMNSDLNLFDENSMSEAEDIDLDCLTCFTVSDDIVNNSLRFLPVKFF